MQLKPIAAMVVLLLVIASLLVSGCITQPTVSVTATSLGSANSLTDSYGVVKTPSSGNKFVKYAVYLQNINAKGIQMGNANFFKLRDTESNLYSYDQSTFTLEQRVNGVTLKGVMPQMNTQVGDKYSGLLVFQIPTSATPKSLTYDDYTNTITINL